MDAKIALEATKAAEKVIQAEQNRVAKKAAREDKALQNRMRKRAKDFLTLTCEPAIMEAANLAKQTAVVDVSTWEQEITQADLYLASFTQKLLEKKDFQVEITHRKMDPFGSAPIYPYTVYRLSIRIWW